MSHFAYNLAAVLLVAAMLGLLSEALWPAILTRRWTLFQFLATVTALCCLLAVWVVAHF
jgi:hypothetical protein